ncbi:MAG: alpha/beta hydrolase [Parasphingorhabdus sp.]|uniref:alpha/beta hydrolase n=1 Tax=Parasphingorhabdus sp. TaxID=2709688 RepID=UPI0032661398
MEQGRSLDIAGNRRSSEGFGGLFVGAFLLVAFLLLPAVPAHSASSYVVTETIETLEYEIYEPVAPVAAATSTLGQYGPFRVVAHDAVEMTGTVDSYTPAAFRQMLGQFPGIKRIEMIDCDGSVDEEANLNLARMIRRAGISTHVPAHGSVRSGAVELFLAGLNRTAHQNAEFIVHSWMDEDGREANDYPANDPVHAEYLDYYAEMGVPVPTAKAFYALTNSVPFSDQLRLSRSDMARFQLLH